MGDNLLHKFLDQQISFDNNVHLYVFENPLFQLKLVTVFKIFEKNKSSNKGCFKVLYYSRSLFQKSSMRTR